jgi:hypothetical protein
MSRPSGSSGGLLARTDRACRFARRFDAAGRTDLAERLLKRVTDRAAAACDWPARQHGCESLARLYLRHGRFTEAAVWHQQAIAAALRTACDGADASLAIAIAAANRDRESIAAWQRWKLGPSGTCPCSISTATLARAARWHAATGNWAAALATAAIAEAAAAGHERRTTRRLRTSLELLAALQREPRAR